MTDIAFIQSLLRELGAFFRTEVGNRFEIDGADKSEPGDRVTEVDVAVQKYIVDRIQERCPTDAVYGEEAGYDILPVDLSERCWVIDPLDGTYNFQRTLSPAYAVSIALRFTAEGFMTNRQSQVTTAAGVDEIWNGF